MAHKAWKGKTEGTERMHSGLVVLFRFLNLRVAYAFMAVFVIPFYLLFAHQGYIAQYHFFRRRMRYGVLKSFLFTYKNHFRFGQVILDRFAAFAGVKFHFKIEGYNRLLEEMKHGEGIVILSAHMGSYELAGYAFKSETKRYNALVFPGESHVVMEGRSRLLSQNNIRMIPVREDFSHIFTLNAALADGEIVSIPGDRIFGSPKSVNCRFFGSEARFPLGPYALAVSRDATVMATFVMKESAYRYHAFIYPLKVRTELKRNERAQDLAQQMAARMEEVLEKYPCQWFNYFEYWKE